MKNIFAAAVLMAASLVSAQSGAYERCGGIGFTGCKSCISGYHCTKFNDCELPLAHFRFGDLWY